MGCIKLLRCWNSRTIATKVNYRAHIMYYLKSTLKSTNRTKFKTTSNVHLFIWNPFLLIVHDREPAYWYLTKVKFSIVLPKSLFKESWAHASYVPSHFFKVVSPWRLFCCELHSSFLLWGIVFLQNLQLTFKRFSLKIDSDIKRPISLLCRISCLNVRTKCSWNSVKGWLRKLKFYLHVFCIFFSSARFYLIWRHEISAI